jgi:hypothetical protein
MVQSGRLTEDHKNEFGGLIAEHMYDMQNIKSLIQEVVNAGAADLQRIEQQIQGEIAPNINDFKTQSLRATEQQVQQGAASVPGYEALQDPTEWQRLIDFVSQKIESGGYGPDGKPVFNPDLDPQTACQMYDAMTGAELRQKLLAQKALEEQQAKDGQTAAAVSGETAAKAGGPPVQRQPSKMTPQEEAMDFSDPHMTAG